VHTGLPNPGLGTAMKDFRGKWARFPVPVVLHLVAHSPDEMRRMIGRIEEAALEGVSGIEVGISDDATTADAAALVRAAAENGELPVLARLPFASTGETAHALADAGADGLVACAPPRGTARDRAGRLIPGRLYGPLIKPLMLRLVGQIARQAGIPVVGAGGIHSTADARDYLDAGAAAVAIDSAVWVRPRLAAAIAADLGGDTHTQPGETAD
jgi:dihydroorotate dehydrogenase (NAD+) catalytic subunit